MVWFIAFISYFKSLPVLHSHWKMVPPNVPKQIWENQYALTHVMTDIFCQGFQNFYIQSWLLLKRNFRLKSGRRFNKSVISSTDSAVVFRYRPLNNYSWPSIKNIGRFDHYRKNRFLELALSFGQSSNWVISWASLINEVKYKFSISAQK